MQFYSLEPSFFPSFRKNKPEKVWGLDGADETQWVVFQKTDKEKAELAPQGST